MCFVFVACMLRFRTIEESILGRLETVLYSASFRVKTSGSSYSEASASKPSRIPVKHRERTLNKSRGKRRLLRRYVKKNVPVSSRIPPLQRNMYFAATNIILKKEDKQKHTSKAALKCRQSCCVVGLRKSKKCHEE